MAMTGINALNTPKLSTIQSQTGVKNASVQFGSDSDEADVLELGATAEADETDQADDARDDASLKDQLRNEAEDFKSKMKKNELVRGAGQFVGVLSKSLAFNSILKEGNPESSVSDRAYAVLQLAFAQMNDVINGSQGGGRPDGSNMYYSVLSRFPGLVLDESIDYPNDSKGNAINIVEKAIQNSSALKPATVRSHINDLVETYAEQNLKDDMTRAELSRDLAKAFGVRVN